MVFTEIWLHSDIPNNVIDLTGRDTQIEWQMTPARAGAEDCAFM